MNHVCPFGAQRELFLEQDNKNKKKPSSFRINPTPSEKKHKMFLGKSWCAFCWFRSHKCHAASSPAASFIRQPPPPSRPHGILPRGTGTNLPWHANFNF